MVYAMKIFGGTANQQLSSKISKVLGGAPLSQLSVKRFADGETSIQIMENVRGNDVFIVQPTCTVSATQSVNDNLMELCLTLDAMKRASAARITAVLPYFGYARQDRKTKPRVPISAALVARMIESAGADRILSVDLHCGQIQGFFNIPVDNLYAKPVLVPQIVNILNQMAESGETGDLVVVSPDAGGAERADMFKADLNRLQLLRNRVSMAVMNKQRLEANIIARMELVGDVKDKNCVIVDDMIDTAGTLVSCSEILRDHGAKNIYACATHALFNGSAIEKIEQSPIQKVIVTDTLPLSEEKSKCEKILQVTTSHLIVEAIKRVHKEESLKDLFE